MIDRSSCLRIVLSAVLLSGCQRDGTAPAAAPRASVALRVLVVNEPELAEAIHRLRGEWAERSGGRVSATATEWKDVAAAKGIDADIIIFPSRYLGELCTRGWLRPVRPSVLEGGEFKGGDVFPLVRRELMRWGDRVMVLPLGVEPVIPGRPNRLHPAINLLAIAAPAAVSGRREGVLFNPETMKPRITDVAFVDALQRLANPESNSRKSKDAKLVPVLGFGDRLLGVTSSSHNGASAFKLAAWLASADIGPQLRSAGERLLPVRSSPATRKEVTQSSVERADDTKIVERILNAERCLLLPRIPGIDEYLASLDEAANSPSADNTEAAAALKKVAERWEQITNAHGRDAQRQAYWKHLEISD